MRHSIAAAVAACSVLLAACGGGGADTATTASAKDANAPATILALQRNAATARPRA